MHSPLRVSERDLYALIMAGGEGTRFFPLSTPERPKQFLSFLGEGTFLQQTKRRIGSFVKDPHVLVATNEKYIPLVLEQLPLLPKANIIGEPQKKNTAPCIAFAAKTIQAISPNAVMVVLPSDHFILDESQYVNVLQDAVDIAVRERCLVTIGITPEWPSTAYGYIHRGGAIDHAARPSFYVKAFVEKPNEEMARQYIRSGDYTWNSGIFVWPVEVVLNEFERHLPSISRLLGNFETTDSFRHFFFEHVESISIDYGVMERSDRVVVVPASFGWNDIGTWESLHRLSDKGEVKIAPEVLRMMQRQQPRYSCGELKI